MIDYIEKAIYIILIILVIALILLLTISTICKVNTKQVNYICEIKSKLSDNRVVFNYAGNDYILEVSNYNYKKLVGGEKVKIVFLVFTLNNKIIEPIKIY